MNTKMHLKRYHIIPLLLILCAACKNSTTPATEETAVKTQTPVTITNITIEPLTDYITLSATSTFMQKNYVKANANGYINAVNVQVGKYVSQGQLLFTLKTKESMSIGNEINKLDPSFRFSGVNQIKASGPGYINQLNHQAGDYVQDGEQLAVINDANSFAFLLNLPYELRPYILDKKTVELLLPDSTKLTGTIASIIPAVDPVAQTQQVVIKVAAASAIPENLIAKVRVVKSEKPGAQTLPKAALLSNDVQNEYWVMKLINDTTAVKIPVKKGMETKDKVEIVSPVFTPVDRILLTGNYGLPDTAQVKITAPAP